MEYVLGIDAGGTKTICLMASETGRVIAEARGGGANLSTAGELAVEKTLHHVMEEAIGERPIRPAVICVGLAGADRPADAETVQAIMRRIGYKARVVIVNDALVALVAGAGDGPGVVSIAGTGSITYGRNAANQAARSGGWGHVLGDEGSGYWIGRHALAAVMREHDGRGEATALTPAVLAHFELERPEELVQIVYYRGLALPAIAALGPVVDRARAAGDPVATQILDGAVAEIVLGARSVVSRLGMIDDTFPFVLAGGIFHGVPWLASETARRLPEVAPGASVRRLEIQPATGAIALAVAELRGGARLPRYLDGGEQPAR